MRKALILLMVFALVGAAAFAEGATASWKIGMWSGLGVVSSGSTTTVVPYDYSWVGAGAWRVGFKYTAADGNSGFNSRLQMTPGALPAVFNQLNGWVKLFGGMVTVRAGVLDDYTIATADWNNFGKTDGKLGMYFNLAPIAGLDIGYFQPIPTASIAVENVYNGSIIGLAYKIGEIGSVQAGAKLSSVTDATQGTAVYFGFNLSAVKNLTAILEGQVSLYDGSSPIALEQNVGYAMGNLTVGARIGENINGSDFSWGVEPTVGYKVNDQLSLAVIANVYNDPAVTFMSPIDAAVVTGGVAGDVNFGGGVSVSYSAGGFTLTLGDYYAAATGGGNVVYLNADLSL